jgi:hypothetical protein
MSGRPATARSLAKAETIKVTAFAELRVKGRWRRFYGATGYQSQGEPLVAYAEGSDRKRARPTVEPGTPLFALAAKHSLLVAHEWDDVAERLRAAGVTISSDQLAQLAKRHVRVVIH